jgi:hypothetical protein
MPRHIEDEAKMIADIRVLHEKVIELSAGIADLRLHYTDQELAKYAEIAQVRFDAKLLHRMVAWLGTIADALSDREVKKNGGHRHPKSA